MPQVPFNTVVTDMEQILGDKSLPPETRARFADELLQKSGWDKENFKKNYDYVKARASAGETAMGGMISGLTLGLEDEIRAGMGAATDVLRGEEFGPSFARRRGVQKAVEERREKEQGPIKLGTEIAGSVVSPLARLGQGAQSLWARLAAGTGVGTVQGAASAGDDLQARATGAGIGALAGGAGQALGEIPRAAASIFKTPGSEVVEAAGRLGIDPTAGMMGGPTAKSVEMGLRNIPLAMDPMEAAARRTGQQIEQTQAGIGQRMAAGAPETPVAAGAMLKDVAKETGESVDRYIEKSLDALVREVGPDTASELAPLETLRQSLLAERAKAPRASAGLYAKPLSVLNGIMSDAEAAGGVLPYDVLRKLRSDLGSKIFDKQASVASGYTGGVKGQMERVYGAMRDSLIQTAEKVSPEAAGRAHMFDRFVTNYRQGSPQYAAPVDVLDKILKSGNDERAWNILTSGSPKQLEQLRQLTNRFGKGAWDSVAASVWNTMGRSTTGAAGDVTEFNMASFLKNWNKMDPAKRRQIFRGTKFQAMEPEINDLMTVVKSYQETLRKGNPSGTARNLLVSQLLGNIGAIGAGGALGYAQGGDIRSAATGAVAGAVPWMSGKALSSPTALRLINKMARAKEWPTMAAAASQLSTEFLNPDEQQSMAEWLAEQRKTMP